MTGYTESDYERWVTETGHNPQRSPFARDRARVVHSAALRRLATKTQVVEPQYDDFVRNRLTHSLEVAQIGRELAAALGCDADLVDAACLAHDLGHPPFGHNGETTLHELATTIGGFEGNAQTLRIVTYLEPKIADPATGRSVGLNLARATVDACTKYPWPLGRGPDGAASAKFGVYADDLAVFNWMRQDAPAGQRCCEAQLMDVADDIAYSVHDFEDAVVAGHVMPARLADADLAAQVVATTQEWYEPNATTDELHQALQRVRQLTDLAAMPMGERATLAALKNLTSSFVGRFTQAVRHATREHYPIRPVLRYRTAVVVPSSTRLEMSLLKGVVALRVMSAARRQPVYERQHELLCELFTVLLDGAPERLDPQFRSDYLASGTDAARTRVVVDQVASLTDARAIRWHHRYLR